MKREYRRRRLAAAGELSPRRNRRGLIEALTHRSLPLMPGPASLPGGIAGASLKRLVFSLMALATARSLPGGIAGASLKRDEQLPGRGEAEALPGGIAGASLKP